VDDLADGDACSLKEPRAVFPGPGGWWEAPAMKRK